MKFNLSHCGAIDEACIVLRPLTVFVGQNNVGKTWTAFAISSIFNPAVWRQYSSAYVSGGLEEQYSQLNQTIDTLLQNGAAKFNLISFFSSEGKEFINNIARFSLHQLNEFLGSSRPDFTEADVKVDLTEGLSDFKKNIQMYAVKSTVGKGKSGVGLINAEKKTKDSEIYFYLTEDEEALSELPDFIRRDFITFIIISSFFKGFNNRTYYLPVERTGIFTFFRRSRNQKGPVIQEEIDDSSPAISLAYPISDLINLKISAENSFLKPDQRVKEAKKDKFVQKYIELSRILEKDILEGDIFYSSESSVFVDDLLYRLNSDDKVVLDMPVVSSMVKDNTPLVLYLRYLAKFNDLILIDEPEMNLHPRAQAKFIEFLSILVHNGLNVIITTHSPYIVDHLVNLMQAETLQDKESICGRFYLHSSDAFIPKGDVSVYLFEKKKALNILSPEGRINWETFSRVSDEIMDLFIEDGE
ncbi:MAG: ATP-binding protein [Methanobacteriota archaeon]